MKISVNAGHTLSGVGGGAVYKGFRESELTRAVVKALIPKLKQRGHVVHNSTVDSAASQSAYLQKVCQLADDSGAELFISIHCNASATRKGHGVECYTWKGKNVIQAAKICAAMAGLGFRNRGVKDGSAFYVVRNTKAVAILVELFFLDNYTDRKLYIDHGAEKIAEAIAKSI